MKSLTERIISLVLAFAICMSLVCVPAYAADSDDIVAKHATVTLDGANDSSAVVNFEVANDFGIYVFEAELSTAEEEGTNYIELNEIASDTFTFDSGYNMASVDSGYVFWSDDNFSQPAVFSAGSNLLTATYKVAADTPAGEYEVKLNVLYIYFDNDDEVEEVEYTAKITVSTASTPSCDHENKTYTYEVNDGDTHKVICECGETVNANADCSGGTADCENLAVCQFCEDTYGSYGDHAYGTLIEAQPEVHTKDELKGAVAAHYQCSVCEKYFTEAKAETTLPNLTNPDPKHDHTTKTETTSATCDQDGKVETVTFCSVCGKEHRREITSTIPAGSNCTFGAPTYSWSDNTCTATRVCKANEAHKETETVTGTRRVTVEGSCTVKEVYVYDATFRAEWAEARTSEPITGEKNMNNHASNEFTYVDNGETHTKKNKCCGAEVETVPHDYNTGTSEHTCACGKGETLSVLVFDGVADGDTLLNSGFVTSSLNTAEYDKEFKTTLSTKGNSCYVLWVNVGDKENRTFTFEQETGVLTIPAEDVTGNIVIAAIARQRITIDPNGGAIEGRSKKYECEIACHNGLTFSSYYLLGHELVAMNTKPDGTGTSYRVVNVEGDYVVEGFSVIDGGILYAQWAPETYTIKWYDGYYANPDDYTSWVETYHQETTVKFGEILTPPATLPTKEGYNQVGWLFENDGGVVSGVEIGKPLDKVFYTAMPIWECAHANTQAVDNKDGQTHNVVCTNPECKGHVVEENVHHDYNTGTSEHTCACGKKEEFTITWVDGNNNKTTTTVQYNQMPAYEGTPAKNADSNFTYEFKGWDKTIEVATKNETYTAQFYRTGWDGKQYLKRDQVLKGWTEIDGAWYYLKTETGVRAEGLTRAPYPTEKINGKTYAPDQEAIDYATSKGETFYDAEEAWFLFDVDGKFLDGTNGIALNKGNTVKLVNGMLAWHPGVVSFPGAENYLYFIGDEDNGGNKLATGDIYVSRANVTKRQFKIGGLYTFGEDGTLCNYQGITKVNGTLRYYGSEGADLNRLMLGNGLTQVTVNEETKYIYVRSNGELVVSAEYWIDTEDFKGMYEFDENGYMIIPEVTEKDGIYFENDAWYFYEDGKIGYNKGLLKLDDGSVIYVRSNGQLATGAYYVTNLDNYDGTDIKSGDKVTFGDDGKMVAAKNGIVDGYYYENGKIVYNAGVIQLDGKYYYVRSNGKVATGSYWITNVGDSGVAAKLYNFNEDGSFIPEMVEDQKNGIVDGYYYENGQLACGRGLLRFEDEDGYYLIYVRSNGQLATGIYWPTTKNEIDVAGSLNFGTDGICRLGE